MFTDPAFTLADQFFWIVDCFRKSMWAEPCTRGLGALSIAIWVRVKGFERRFSGLYAMWKAGTLPKRRVRAEACPAPQPTGSSPVATPHSPSRGEGEEAAARAYDPMAADAGTLDRARLRPASVLPRAFRWLQKMLPMSAGTLAAGVESLLGNYPEMKEFVAACPQAGRVLRPMCRMAGLRVPEWLALPRRGRGPGLRRQPAAASRLRGVLVKITPHPALLPQGEREKGGGGGDGGGRRIDRPPKDSE